MRDHAPLPPWRFAAAAARVASLVVLAASGGTLAGCAGERAAPDPTPIATATPAAVGGEGAGMHDHTPHHGGIVGMSGSLHLEALAFADGRVALWVTDFWRKKVPVETISGTVTIDLPTGKQRLQLSSDGEGLAAAGPALTGDGVEARFELLVGDEPALIDFFLPIAYGVLGAAGVPVAGCEPVDAAIRRGGQRVPRCVLPFHRDVAVIAASPAGDRLWIAALQAWVSEWAMPAVDLLFSFAPPPPIAIVDPAATPHPEVAAALAVRPDGAEVVVALDDRLLRFASADGLLRRELPQAGGTVRGVAWSPDGRSLLVAAAARPAVRFVAAEDGAAERVLPIAGDATAIALSPGGEIAAVALDAGGVSLFDARSGELRATLDATGKPVRALAFAASDGDLRLYAGGSEGVLWVFDAASAAPLDAVRLGRPILRLAPAPAAGIVAVSGERGELRLVDRDGATVESLRWHGTSVTGLAWAADALVSGDEGGRIAVWDLADRLR